MALKWQRTVFSLLKCILMYCPPLDRKSKHKNSCSINCHAIQSKINKFGALPVKITGCDDHRPNTRANRRYGHETNPKNSVLLWNLPDIFVSGLKASLRYLRCFGASINNLKVFGDGSGSKRHEYVQQYIGQFCAGNLLTLAFDWVPYMAIEEFQDDFTE